MKTISVTWRGDNLREVIDTTGLHPSAKKWTWEEYEDVVRREGLKVFTGASKVMVAVGDTIINSAGVITVLHP